MRLRTTLCFASTSILARPGRSLALAGGVALCIALYVAMNTLADGYARLIRRPLEVLSADVTIQRPGAPRSIGAGGRITMPPANTPLTAEDVARASTLPHVAGMSSALLLWDRAPKGFTVIMGIDPVGHDGLRVGPSVIQEWVGKGRPLEREGDLLVEEHFAKLNRLTVGDRFGIGGKELAITGLVKMKEGGALIPANAFVTLAQAREIAALPPDSSNVLFARFEKGTDVDMLRGELSSRLPGAVMTTSDSIREMMRGFGVISGRFSTIIGILALGFAAIACHRLIAGAVQERRAEFGVMKAVGWRHKDISGVLTAEFASLGLGSGVLGVVLGYLAAILIGDMMLASQPPLQLTALPAGIHPSAGGNEAVHLPVAISWVTGATALAVSVMVTGIAGWLVSRKMAGACVMDALRQP